MCGKPNPKTVVLGTLAPVAQKFKEIMDMIKVVIDADHYDEVITHLSDALAEIALGYAEAEGIDIEGIKVDVEKGLIILTLREGGEDG